ncbi:MAG: vitamin K epoxide reductase family protein [Chthoniobacter sp.]
MCSSSGSRDCARFFCPARGACETVLSSQFAQVQGIPLPWLGVLFYLLLLALWLPVVASEAQRRRLWLVDAILWLLVIGLTFSAGLMYLQFAVIHAFCPPLHDVCRHGGRFADHRNARPSGGGRRDVRRLSDGGVDDSGLRGFSRADPGDGKRGREEFREPSLGGQSFHRSSPGGRMDAPVGNWWSSRISSAASAASWRRY